MSDGDTDALLRNLDPRTMEEDLRMYEENTHRPTAGVRQLIDESGPHVPQPPEFHSPPRDVRSHAVLSGVVGGDEDHYSLPPPTGSESMVHEHLGTAAPERAPAVPNTFAELFQSISANQGGSVRFASEPRPTPHPQAVDSTYHERRELLGKIDDMRLLGFSMPTVTELNGLSVEDLRSEVRRRTMSNDTNTLVNSACSVICGVAKWLELGNSLAGGVLPLQGYAASVEEATKTPRFRFAIYQVILKMGGRISAGPFMEIAIVMLFPIVQAVVAKTVVYFSRGRIPLTAQGVHNGMAFATSELVEGLRPDVNDGGGVMDGVAEEAEESEESDTEENPFGSPLPSPRVAPSPSVRGVAPPPTAPMRRPMRRPGYVVPG